MQKDRVCWRPLTSAEQFVLNERWLKLWPSDAEAIQSAVKVLKREGFDAIHRSAYHMVMRTQTMPSAYWPGETELTENKRMGIIGISCTDMPNADCSDF